VTTDAVELDQAAEDVALAFRDRMAEQSLQNQVLAEHFASTLETLYGLLAAMARAAPAERLNGLVSATSEAHVADLLEQVALKMLAAREAGAA
jgi:hypothetical protein